MRAFDPEVVDVIWAAIEPLIPVVADTHPLGCHRPRVPDRDCFQVILVRLATGCSWEDAERLCANKVSDTTVRARRDDWIAAGVFDAIANEAIAAYDRVIGLELSDVAVDGSLHKSPGGGEGTGKNPTDRAKLGWKWSILTDTAGIPIGWTVDGANRNDSILLAPTLDDAAGRGLLAEIETLWLDRGYDSDATRARLDERGITDAVIAKKRRRGSHRCLDRANGSVRKIVVSPPTIRGRCTLQFHCRPRGADRSIIRSSGTAAGEGLVASRACAACSGLARQRAAYADA